MELQPCPSRPTCVSTQAEPDDIDHYIRAIKIGELSAERALNLVADMVIATRRMLITGRAKNLLQVRVRSRVLRLRSDLTFTCDEEAGLLHFRSASRLGLFDFHSNRKRMEDMAPLIRERLRDLSENRSPQLSVDSPRPSNSEPETTPSGATIGSTVLRSVKSVEIENTAEPSAS
ncbi:MAG: DUF1499 domain-containing protein [Acidimicrobiia bacterium]|nr:DUF1499 domain-containing protein [Acidimicrobiia bacterium]